MPLGIVPAKESGESDALILIAAVAIFFVNYLNFFEVFYVKDVYDPISYALLSAKKIVP
jgi:hypothetical protein